MSLYNTLHGHDPLTPALLQVLGLIMGGSVARFRDIHLNHDGTRILLLTRTGGGNRDDYSEWWINIRQHPYYLSDHDDDFDSTFAIIEFQTPEEYLADLRPFATGKDPETLKQKMERTMKELRSMTPEQIRTDRRTRDIVKLLAKIMGGDGDE